MRSTADDEAMAPGKKQKALIITSDSAIALALRNACSDSGIDVFIASTPGQALHDLQNLFDLVIIGDDLPLNSQRTILNYITQRWLFVTPTLLVISSSSAATHSVKFDHVADLATLTAAEKSRKLIASILDQRNSLQAYSCYALTSFVEVRVANYGTIIGRIHAIGSGSVFVSLPLKDLPEVGSFCQIRVDASPEKWNQIEGTGSIRWLRERTDDSKWAGIGIQFCTINQSALTKLLGFVNDAAAAKQKQQLPLEEQINTGEPSP